MEDDPPSVLVAKYHLRRFGQKSSSRDRQEAAISDLSRHPNLAHNTEGFQDGPRIFAPSLEPVSSYVLRLPGGDSALLYKKNNNLKVF